MTERTLTRSEEESLQATIEALRAQPHYDEHAQKLEEKWARAAFTASKETMDQIGVLWLRHILGIDERTIETFIKDPYDSHAEETIGRRNSAIPLDEIDHRNFWQEVAKLDSRLVTEEELKTLTEYDPRVSFCLAHHLIFRLDITTSKSHILSSIQRNAGAWK